MSVLPPLLGSSWRALRWQWRKPALGHANPAQLRRRRFQAARHRRERSPPTRISSTPSRAVSSPRTCPIGPRSRSVRVDGSSDKSFPMSRLSFGEIPIRGSRVACKYRGQVPGKCHKVQWLSLSARMMQR